MGIKSEKLPAAEIQKNRQTDKNTHIRFRRRKKSKKKKIEKKSEKNPKKNQKNRASAYICFCRLRAKSRI